MSNGLVSHGIRGGSSLIGKNKVNTCRVRGGNLKTFSDLER